MARKSMVVKSQRKPKYKVREYTRCKRCGRPHAVITKAKKSIAGFKLREGQAIGCKVTLRGETMYTFLEKLIKIVLPRVRDFRGISTKAFDGRGNYTLGIKEQTIFPEIVYDEVVKVRGMDIVFVTTAKTNEEALDLLKGFGLPFKK